LTRGDILLLTAVVVLALLAFSLSNAVAGSGATEAIIHSPTGTTSVSLDETRRYEIEGAHGVVVLEVSDGHIRAVRADCPDHLCVKSGIAVPGRPIVCAPNGVSVTVYGSGGEELDAVSR